MHDKCTAMKKLLLASGVLAMTAIAAAQTAPEVHFNLVNLPTDGTTTSFELPKFTPKGRKLVKVETNVYFDSTLTLTMTAPAGQYVYQVLGETSYTLPHLGTFTKGIASNKKMWNSDGQTSSITYNAVNYGNTQTFTEHKDLAHFLGAGTYKFEAGAKFWADTSSNVNWSLVSVPSSTRGGNNAVVVVRYYYN